MARGIAKSEEDLTSRRQRKKIEMLFAHLKRIRVLTGSDCEVRTVPATSSTWQQ